MNLVYQNDSTSGYVSNLSTGSSFTTTINNETVTYTVTAAGLQAVSEGVLKVRGDLTITSTGEYNVAEDWNFDNTNFVPAVLTDSSTSGNLRTGVHK